MTLLFDFGGVLVNLDKSRCIEAFRRIGFDIRPYLGTFRQAGPFEMLERGTVSVPEFCDRLRALTPGFTASDECITAAWESYLTDVPAERLEMLLKIRRHYPVSLLSNTNAIHWRMAEEKFFRYRGLTVRDFFDHTFLSYELGEEKPAPAVFRAVAEKLGVPPGDILFLDDAEENCAGARRCGLQSLLAPAGSGWFKLFDNNGKLLPL